MKTNKQKHCKIDPFQGKFKGLFPDFSILLSMSSISRYPCKNPKCKI